jgi:branched-chain amino acid transport system substrate-binding protein
MVMADSMKRANSVEPAKFLPEVGKTSYDGVTALIQFDQFGDLKGGAISVYQYKGGMLEYVETLGGGAADAVKEAAQATGDAAKAVASAAADATRDAVKAGTEAGKEAVKAGAEAVKEAADATKSAVEKK